MNELPAPHTRMYTRAGPELQLEKLRNGLGAVLYWPVAAEDVQCGRWRGVSLFLFLSLSLSFSLSLCHTHTLSGRALEKKG